MALRDKDYYKILQVDPSAEQEVIEAAYRRLARLYHPDVSQSPNATLRMQEINAAYGVLHNPTKRAHYDSERFTKSSEADARYEEERRKREAAEAGQRRAQEEAQTAWRRVELEQRAREEAEARQRRAQQEAQSERVADVKEMESCKGCGQLIKGSDLTCPHCGYTEWGYFIIVGTISIAFLSGAIWGYVSIQDELWRNVAAWCAGIVGSILMLAVISEAITAIRTPKR